MKNVLIFPLSIFCMLCFSNASYSQQGFSMQYDTLYSQLYPLPNYAEIKVAACPDGGYGLISTHAAYTTPYLLKTDSMGVPQWMNRFPVAAPDPEDVNGYDIMATADSGFLYSANQQNNMFGGFKKTMLYKLNISGSIQTSKQTVWGSFGTDSYLVPFNDYNYDTKIISSTTREAHYNGTNGSCCYHMGFVRMDHSFNVISAKELIDTTNIMYSMRISKEIHVNGILQGFLTFAFYNQKTAVIMLDTSGNVLWSKRFLYKTVTDVVQVDSSIFVTGANYALNKVFIHKMDLNGNTNFFKIISSPDYISVNEIAASNNSTLYVAGTVITAGQVQSSQHALMAEMDTDGNILQAYESNDSTTNYASVDIFSKAFLFTRNYSNLGGGGFAFTKVFIDNPTCNFYASSITIVDSVLIEDSVNVISQPYVLPILSAGYGKINSGCIAVPLCGPLSTLNHKNAPEFSITPNPVQDILTIHPVNKNNIPRSVMITCITGREVYHNTAFSGEHKIDVSDLSKGIYVLQIETAKETFIEKFVVN